MLLQNFEFVARKGYESFVSHTPELTGEGTSVGTEIERHSGAVKRDLKALSMSLMSKLSEKGIDLFSDCDARKDLDAIVH